MPFRYSVGSPLNADFLFPSEEGGLNVTASPEAVALARRLFEIPTDQPDSVIVWDLPDVCSCFFEGSITIGTASFDGRTVEFYFEN